MVVISSSHMAKMYEHIGCCGLGIYSANCRKWNWKLQ